MAYNGWTNEVYIQSLISTPFKKTGTSFLSLILLQHLAVTKQHTVCLLSYLIDKESGIGKYIC